MTEQTDCNSMWGPQEGWIYLGNGEWVEPIQAGTGSQHGNKLEKEPEWKQEWLKRVDKDIWLHNEVLRRGYPNRWGARMEIESKWNLELFSSLLTDYYDREVTEWLRYGWPTGRLPTLQDPQLSFKNHKGAADHPEALSSYILKEKKHGAVMVPYMNMPFEEKIGISPLSTREKKNSQERRIILDLSFPVGNSVNDGILKDNYLGFRSELTFPKVDEFACRIYNLGQGCKMFKIDLSRYFRQIPLDPGDYSIIGYVIDEQIYFDKVLPMGMRSAPYIAQRITNAIAYIHRRLEYFLLNYVDDFVGAESEDRAWEAYRFLTLLLQNLGVEASEEKRVEPTTRLEFLGITFDSNTMTMEVSTDKLTEARMELKTWLYKTSARRKEVESLVGKLQFHAKCIKSGRVFTGRLIQWLRSMDRKQTYSIPREARRDIAWWARFMEEYNGISLMWMFKEPTTDQVLATDACKRGYGGIMNNEYIRGRFPSPWQNKNIATLELWAVIVAIKTWADQLRGKYFWIHVDNEAVASILNSGRGRDPELQEGLREVAYIAAKNQFVIKARHIPGVDNRIPDWLSRWDEIEARKSFRQHAMDRGLKHRKTSVNLLQLSHDW